MKIGQFFYSLQGEGTSSGVPAFFIRFAGCNLNCGMDGNGDWICDSIAQWTRAEEITPEQLWEKMISESGLNPMALVNALTAGLIHIVYTGGEPMLASNRTYMNEINMMLRLKGVAVYKAEIETNGTLDPNGSLDTIFGGGVDVQINCSPKLASSGIPRDKRINLEALISLIEYTKRRAGAKMFFKFVVAKEDDVREILDLLAEISESSTIAMPALKRMTMLMPAGETREKIIAATPQVWNWCTLFQFMFSSRLHIVAFDRRIDV